MKHGKTTSSSQKDHAGDDAVSQRDIDIFHALLDEYVAHPDWFEPQIYGGANIQQCDQARNDLESLFAGNGAGIAPFRLESLQSFAFAVTNACNFPDTCAQYGYEEVMRSVGRIDRYLLQIPIAPDRAQPRKPSLF